MSGQAKPYHRGTHKRTARNLTTLAYANPTTQCQATNCKGWGSRTLAEHPPTKTGKPPRWQAGHINAGQIGGPYRPEVNVCNLADGARIGNTMRQMEPRVTRWWT